MGWQYWSCLCCCGCSPTNRAAWQGSWLPGSELWHWQAQHTHGQSLVQGIGPINDAQAAAGSSIAHCTVACLVVRLHSWAAAGLMASKVGANVGSGCGRVGVWLGEGNRTAAHWRMAAGWAPLQAATAAMFHMTGRERTQLSPPNEQRQPKCRLPLPPLPPDACAGYGCS